MVGELQGIAQQCDGVRCDMAMLVLPEVFERTWGLPAGPFWPEATARVRERHPEFSSWPRSIGISNGPCSSRVSILPTTSGFTIGCRDGPRARARHLHAGLDYQSQLARFLENHDEPRAAATFPAGKHEAAALVTYLTPGLRFFHQGQFEGYRKRISPHLVRGPVEPVNTALRGFYQDLLTVLRRSVVRDGAWRLLDCAPAWDGNWTHDCILVWCWQGPDGGRLLATVNYTDHQSQCYVRLPWPDLSGAVRLSDLMSPATYDRDGPDLAARGLYLDLPAWGRHVFELSIGK